MACIHHILNNYILYTKVFDNLNAVDLYYLWTNPLFTKSIEDYLYHSKNVNWNKFPIQHLCVTFIQMFKHKLSTKCIICKKINTLNNGRFIVNYINIETINQDFICLECDDQCRISNCNKCKDNSIHGLLKCCMDDCGEYGGIHFICQCSIPMFVNICKRCIIKYKYTDFYCQEHLYNIVNKTFKYCVNCNYELF